MPPDSAFMKAPSCDNSSLSKGAAEAAIRPDFCCCSRKSTLNLCPSCLVLPNSVISIHCMCITRRLAALSKLPSQRQQQRTTPAPPFAVRYSLPHRLR
jgi:hypothetical protein